ncbi:MAG: hypothetical protein FWG83_07945, partial [Oscillospiraceae bacterium]|nr:hypothetical protein [Oscillospiraceae bacterium]
HGKYGECGQVQALCKLSGIGYVGSGFSAANACSDKMLTHLILNKAGIKTARYYELERIDIDSLDEKFPDVEKFLDYPMYARPSVAGRSTGVHVAHNREELKTAIKLAFSHHHKILVEENPEGREFECIVWGSVYSMNVSSIAEANDDFELFLPAVIEQSVAEEIRKAAKTAFIAMGCTCFARMSFKLTKNGLYCSRVSNMPGFTDNDIMARLMQESGYEYSDMLDMLIDSAKEA